MGIKALLFICLLTLSVNAEIKVDGVYSAKQDIKLVSRTDGKIYELEKDHELTVIAMKIQEGDTVELTVVRSKDEKEFKFLTKTFLHDFNVIYQLNRVGVWEMFDYLYLKESDMNNENRELMLDVEDEDEGKTKENVEITEPHLQCDPYQLPASSKPDFITCSHSTGMYCYHIDYQCHKIPLCGVDGKKPVDEQCTCALPEIICEKGEYCFYGKCFAKPKCRKSTTQKIQIECVCRNLDGADNCDINQICSYGMNECNFEYSALTGTEVYGEKQYEQEIPGGRIADYANHQRKKTNGYFFMSGIYQGEVKQADDKSYLFDERNNFRLFKTQDKVTNINHFQTRRSKLEENTKYIFVLSPSHELYIANHEDGKTLRADGKFLNHSHFLNGGPVLTAGDLIINEKNVTWSNQSGHYLPDFESLKHILKFFKDQGLTDMKNWKCKNGLNGEPISCHELLLKWEKKKVESLPTMIDIEDGHDTAPAENVEHLL